MPRRVWPSHVPSLLSSVMHVALVILLAGIIGLAVTREWSGVLSSGSFAGLVAFFVELHEWSRWEKERPPPTGEWPKPGRVERVAGHASERGERK